MLRNFGLYRMTDLLCSISKSSLDTKKGQRGFAWSNVIHGPIFHPFLYIQNTVVGPTQ